MRSPRQLLLLGACACALAALESPDAQAQSQRYPPQPKDFDDETEDRSSLWERVLAPNRDRYHSNIDRAKALLRSRDGSGPDQAIELLRETIELAPDEPRGYWLLGYAQEQRDNWSSCADAFEKVAAIDPAYQPRENLPKDAKRAWALDFSLGTCHALEGSYEKAIVDYKRILSRGINNHTIVYHHLGEAYMALGRLGEAIEAFTTAIRLAPDNVRTSYALAVALDRDEKEALSRTHLTTALRQDRSLSRIKRTDIRFIPAEDRLYYGGLAHASRGDVEWAIAYFREYLRATGKGPWARRVRQHLSDLTNEPLSRSRIRVQGTGSIDAARVGKVVIAADRSLQACMKPVPQLLLEVRVTVVGRGSASRSERRRARKQRRDRRAISRVRRAPPPPGIKTDVLRADDLAKPNDVLRARKCVEAVAESIALPRPSGGAGRYVMVSFPLIARLPK